MNQPSKKILGVSVGLIGTILYAQPPYQDFSKNPRVYTTRYSFWFEGNFSGSILRNDSNEQILQYQIDYQYRRMADASYIKDGEYLNIMKDPFQNIIRPWIHYWVISKKVCVSLSPLGYWSTWSPTAEGPHVYTPEFRVCPQITLFQKMGKLDMQQRYRYEFRWIGDPVEAQSFIKDFFVSANYSSRSYRGRMRHMFRLNYNFSKKTYLSIWNEVFIGIGKNVANDKIFDQNRIVILLGNKYFQASYPMKVEVGLTWQILPKYNLKVPPTQPESYGSYQKNNVENNFALQIYLIFNEFHKVFRKKE